MAIAYFDPTATPSRTYGTTIDSISANGTTASTATTIVAPTGWTIVLATTTETPLNQAVELPSTSQVGDIVEVYCLPQGANTALMVFFPSGESLLDGSTHTLVRAGNTASIYRKVGATSWAIMALGST